MLYASLSALCSFWQHAGPGGPTRGHGDSSPCQGSGAVDRTGIFPSSQCRFRPALTNRRAPGTDGGGPGSPTACHSSWNAGPSPEAKMHLFANRIRPQLASFENGEPCPSQGPAVCRHVCYGWFGETLYRNQVWTSAEWDALDPSERPATAQPLAGLGWLHTSPVTDFTELIRWLDQFPAHPVAGSGAFPIPVWDRPEPSRLPALPSSAERSPPPLPAGGSPPEGSAPRT